jgi:hypothetical protein
MEGLEVGPVYPTRSSNSEELNFVEIDSAGHAYALIPIDDD